jgi:hypothetical protein
MEITIPKLNYVSCIFRKIMILVLGVKTRNVDFTETGFTGRTGLIVALYSVINNGLQFQNC